MQPPSDGSQGSGALECRRQAMHSIASHPGCDAARPCRTLRVGRVRKHGPLGRRHSAGGALAAASSWPRRCATIASCRRGVFLLWGVCDSEPLGPGAESSQRMTACLAGRSACVVVLPRQLAKPLPCAAKVLSPPRDLPWDRDVQAQLDEGRAALAAEEPADQAGPVGGNRGAIAHGRGGGTARSCRTPTMASGGHFPTSVSDCLGRRRARGSSAGGGDGLERKRRRGASLREVALELAERARRLAAACH